MILDQLQIAVVQMTSVDSVEANRRIILKILAEVEAHLPKSSLVCFPENALYLRIIEGELIPPFELSDSIFQELAHWAKKNEIAVHLGSIPLRLNGVLYNASVLIDKRGQIRSSYQKLHLFDINLEGRPPIRESDVFSRGTQPHIFEIEGWKFGESICYDLRFSELYLHYSRLGADVLLVPAAFLVETGQAHWEPLLRARAIESQAYVVAAAQGGRHQSEKTSAQRHTYGHSLVVDSWGRILGDQGNQSGVAFYTLERENIIKTRTQIPMQDHRNQRGVQL